MAKPAFEDDLGSPIAYDPNFNGPLRKRSCTDIICLLLFLIFIGCWVGVSIFAYTSGNPNNLLVPKDSAGSRCGLDSHVADKPYLFFFDLTKCLSPTVLFTGCKTKQVCVSKCPDESFVFSDENSKFSKLICDYDIDPTTITLESATKFVREGKCAEFYLKSSSLQKRCIPLIDKSMFEKIAQKIHTTAENLTLSVKNLKSLSKAEQVGQNVVDDLITSWWKILTGVAIAILICTIYILMMRWIAGFMVWLSILGVLALLIAAIYFTTVKYIEFKNNANKETNQTVLESYLTNKDTWLVLLIISVVTFVIISLILLVLRKRIALAIALVKEGSKAVSSVTSVLFFPIFPWILQIGIIGLSVSVALYLSTTGDPLYEIRNFGETCHCGSYKNGDKCIPDEFRKLCPGLEDDCAEATCKFIAMDNPKYYAYLQAFNVVAFLWSSFFVSAFGQMALATVFATWYWTFRKSNLPFFAVIEATLRTLRYHIGTLAFGSLIITICRLIRIGLEWVDQKLKQYDNEVTKAILCCCKCFFWCLEKFLKFINRNAYIMCAIHGKNFCFSAKDAFMLLMRNILRVFVLDKITDFLFFLGKLAITIGVGAIAYLFFATDLTGIDNSGLNYQIVPVIVIMICTYFVATLFFSVYSMAVDTLFLCFLEDCERNDGSAAKPYYMSKNLMKIFHKKNKTN